MIRIRQLLILSILLIISVGCKKEKSDEVFATEFILIDEVFTHENSEDPDKKMGFSAFQFPEDAPQDWISPINFKDGTIYFRVAILSKPDARTIYYQMGLKWEGGCEGHPFKEKFPSNSMLKVNQTGIYDASQAIEEFWEPTCQQTDPIDWSRPADRLLVVIWDENFNQIDDRWGYGSTIQDLYGYYPIQVHFQAIVVAPGEVFSGWENYPITQP